MTNAEREADIRRWFKDHVVEWIVGHQGIAWRHRNGGSNYRVDYILYGSRLFVTGDLESAVYVWPQHITWEFLAGCDLDYFASKCEASTNGRRHREWYEEKAKTSMWNEIKRWYESRDRKPAWPKLPHRRRLAAADDFADFLELTTTEELWEACQNQVFWNSFVNEHQQGIRFMAKGRENVGWFDSEDYDAGLDVSRICHAHLLGLKLAHQQMQAKAAKEVFQELL